MKYKSAYIIQTDYSFFQNLFSKKGLKDDFQYLSSPSCFNDIICSRLSDVNIYDGRLLWRLKLQETRLFKEKYIKRGTNKFYHEFAHNRTEFDLNNYCSLQEALEELNIEFNLIKKTYVNNIGELRYSSKTGFHNCFHRGFTKSYIPKFIENTLYQKDSVFGLTKNQSFSHIPISIGNNLKIKIQYGNFIDKILINDKIFFIQHRLKINLFPYGLLGISLSYSVTSKKKIRTKELIPLQKELEKSNTVYYKKKKFENLKKFFTFLKHNINQSLFKSTEKDEFQDLVETITLNVSIPDGKLIGTNELIGLLDLDKNYPNYNKKYIKSYKSKFGRYEKDVTIFNNNRMVYVLDPRWNYHRTKTLFSWGISDVFSSFHVYKTLIKIFTKKIDSVISKNQANKEDLKFIYSLDTFISNYKNYENLPRPLRKLFYEISNNFRFSHVNEATMLYDKINRVTTINSQKSNFIDFFTLNPNFMGIGVDLNKIIEKISKRKRGLN